MYSLEKVEQENFQYVILSQYSIKPYILLNEYFPLLEDLGIYPYNCIICPIKGSKIQDIRLYLIENLIKLNKEDKNLKVIVLGSKISNELGLKVAKNTKITKYDNLEFCYLPLISKAITDSRQYFKDVVYFLKNSHTPLGSYTIKDKLEDNSKLLKKILQSNNGHYITIDIETNYKLDLSAYIVSIGFKIDDYKVIIKNVASCLTQLKYLLKQAKLKDMRLLFHNATFDIKILIYNLYMNRKFNIDGMLEGLDIFENVEDSKVLCYLHKNSTGLYRTGLKINSFKYLGNYGIDLKNYDYSFTGNWEDKNIVFTNLPDNFYSYNILDCIGTDKLFKDLSKIQSIKRPYIEVFRPSIIPLVKMMLIGLPIDLKKVDNLKNSLINSRKKLITDILNTKVMQEVTLLIRQEYCDERNSKLKKKIIDLVEFDYINFNFNSSKNLTSLMFTYLDLPKYFTTVKGKDSVDKDNIKYALNNLDSWSKGNISKEEVKLILNNLLELSDMKALINTFIPAFEKTIEFEELYGINFLRGSLNLGGTLSGRLSSNDPNLQNLPSNSKYGKKVKECFTAPEGYLIASADYSSLEHRIITIQSQSINLKNIYTKGFDAHSFNAINYFPEEMPDIVKKGLTVENINSIEKLYPLVRFRAKSPTFLMFYGGTKHGLHSKNGFTEEKSEEIEKSFYSMYPEIVDLRNKNIKFAETNQYLPLAFGHKIRTSYIGHNAKGLWNYTKLKEKESKTINNAYSQSWGLLINRAINTVEEKLKKSKYAKRILVINTIHDAVYYLIKKDIDTIEYLNNELIKAMNWALDPNINDKDIPIKAEMQIGTTWANSKPLLNNAKVEDIEKILETL